MGIISINGMRVHAHHGVYEQEQRVGNMFEVNISIDVPDSERAMATDALDDTINYAEIADIVKKEMAKPSRLIEAVAGRIKARLCERFGARIAAGSISIAKLAPPIAAELDSVSYSCRW